MVIYFVVNYPQGYGLKFFTFSLYSDTTFSLIMSSPMPAVIPRLAFQPTKCT